MTAQKEDDDTRSVDWVTVVVTLIGVVWAVWYVWSTRANPYDEPEAAWLITPLLIALAAAAPFVLWSAVGPWPARLRLDPKESLRPSARISFVISLPILAGMIWAGGFVPATLIYVPAMMRVLGERRFGVIIASVVGLLLFILLGFSWGLGVPLPLWPRGF